MGFMTKIKSFFGAQDMTDGNPMSCLLKFSVPLLIGNFAQQLYATVDSIVVGKYVGDTALAAIGVTGPIINLLLVLFMAVATGAGIMVAQYFGAKETDRLGMTVGNSITLALIAALFIMAVGIPLARPLLVLINTPQAILTMATEYMVIIFVGMIGCALYNIISGILRGLGDSIFPLIFLLITSVLNTILDLWFVAGLHWGVAGAAWATIIAQGISAILCIWRIIRIKDSIEFHKKTLIPHKRYTFQLLRLGLPAGLTQAIFSMAMVFVQSLTNQMDPNGLVVTLATAVMRVDGFAMLPNFTFGLALSTYVGQNMGAGKIDRVDQGTKADLKLAVGVSLVLVLALVFFGRYLIALFTETPQLIELGERALRTLAVGYVAMAISQAYGGILRGAGDTMPSMWISLITTVIVRVPLAYLLANLTRSTQWSNGSPDALFFSLLIAWCLGALLTYLWYRRGTWRTISLTKG